MQLPPFSASRFRSRLEALRLAFEAKQLNVSASLQPPLTEQEVRERCSWFPSPLPEELVSLYGWHDGQPNDPWEEKFPFWFRDFRFSCIRNAEQEYKSMMASYGTYPADHELLKHSFPFAAFNGGWLVLPCKTKHPDSPYERAVVSVMQGVDVYFYSMELMVETCIEWVSHPAYVGSDHLSREIEIEIWEKHNPGIFER